MAPPKPPKRSEVVVPALAQYLKYGIEGWTPVDLISQRDARGRFIALNYERDDVRILTGFCDKHAFGSTNANDGSIVLPSAADVLSMAGAIGHRTNILLLDFALADHIIRWFFGTYCKDKLMSSKTKSEAKKRVLDETWDVLAREEQQRMEQQEAQRQIGGRGGRNTDGRDDTGSVAGNEYAVVDDHGGDARPGPSSGQRSLGVSTTAGPSSLGGRPLSSGAAGAALGSGPSSVVLQAPENSAANPLGPPAAASAAPAPEPRIPGTYPPSSAHPIEGDKLSNAVHRSAQNETPDFADDPALAEYLHLSDDVARRFQLPHLKMSLLQCNAAMKAHDMEAGQLAQANIVNSLSEAISNVKLVLQAKKTKTEELLGEYKKLREEAQKYQM